jgi:shikimate dehydrogenase
MKWFMAKTNKKLFGIIGYPLSHSISPFLHENILEKIDLKGCYHAFEVKENKLEAAVQSMKTLGFSGFNVTIPYKHTIVPFLDEIHEEAQTIGAVNTVRIKNNELYGYNTDGLGFIRALRNKNVDINEKSAVILGAGGAARAVACSLIRNGIGKLRVFNRTLERAECLVREVRNRTQFEKIEFGRLSDQNVETAVEASELLVNTTSVGMWPEIEAVPFSVSKVTRNLTVIDLIYNPVETKFLKVAQIAGADIMGGLDMLIYQGVESMKIWTGLAIPV